MEVISNRADIRISSTIGRERLTLKPVVTLPINTHVPRWSIQHPWIKFYFERFTDPNEVYLRSDDPRKCGCQKLSCKDDMDKPIYPGSKEKFPVMACGFCGKKMSTWCIQDGPWGSCRDCFLGLYCSSTLVSTVLYIHMLKGYDLSISIFIDFHLEL
jgi:hypothetical protein